MLGKFSVNLFNGLFHSSLRPLHFQINLLFFNPTKQHSELIFLFFMHDLHSILLKFPYVSSTSSDNKVGVNLKLSTNLSLHVIVLPLSHSFLIGTEKVIYLSILSPIQLNSPFNSIANCSTIK